MLTLSYHSHTFVSAEAFYLKMMVVTSWLIRLASEELSSCPTGLATLWPSYTAPPSWNGTTWSLESSSWLMRWERGGELEKRLKSHINSQVSYCDWRLSLSSHLTRSHWTSTRTLIGDRSTMWFISWTSPSSPLTWLFISSQHSLLLTHLLMFFLCSVKKTMKNSQIIPFRCTLLGREPCSRRSWTFHIPTRMRRSGSTSCL